MLGAGILIILVFVMVFGGIWPGSNHTVTRTITLAEAGFSPQEIIITKGDIVMFRSTRGVPFWPASNLHPSHDIYPEFDPQMPIDSDKEWSFRFDNVGKWQFHDHLAPIYTGTIIVNDGNAVSLGSDTSAQVSKDSCKKLSGGEQKQCWQDLVVSTLERKGLDGAFDQLASLENSETSFPAACHDITHKLGAAAYSLFAAGKDFHVSPKSAYCSFGFYHGFMETLVRSEGRDLAKARQFCEYVDEQLSRDAPNAVFSCYHGIGHGLTDLHNQSEWGNERAMTAPALALCRQVAQNEKQLLLCGTGVFDAISLAYYNNSYGMVMKKDDPLWLCREQADDFKKSCYMDSMPAILWLGKSTLAGAAPYIEKIADETYAVIAMRSLAGNSVRFTFRGASMNPDVSTCRKLKTYLRAACIQGLAQGVMEFGTSEIEYKGALDFCRSPVINEQERATCMKSVFSYASERYSSAKVTEICTSDGGIYKRYCAL